MKAAIAALLLLAGPAYADVVSGKPDSVAVAIYHTGTVNTRELMEGGDPWDGAFGFIVETRQIELPAGLSVIKFRGVASTIVPESVQIDGLPQGSLERNFDYDLLSPGSLLERSLGREVHLVHTDTATGKDTDQTATVRAASEGAILDVGGKYEAPSCGGPPERIVFDELPDGLTETPTLSVEAFVPAAGKYTVKLSYIAMQMNWSADYMARISPDDETLALTGWITLANSSDTSFRNTPAQVIGGRPNTTGDDRAVSPVEGTTATHCWPLDFDWYEKQSAARAELAGMAPVETVVVTGSRVPQVGLYSSSPVTAVVDDFGDYKLYTLAGRTDVAAHQTKQVAFLDQPRVKFERIYSFSMPIYWEDSDADKSEPAQVRYRIQNRAETGLGKPLPGGTISIVDSDSHGAPVFVGQSSIFDTPTDLPVNINTGDALAVYVKKRIVASEKRESANDSLRRYSVEVSVTNEKAAPIRFELSQKTDAGSVRIVEEDQSHVIEEGDVRWKLRLAPGETTKMRYTLEFSLTGR